jgi:hypothetical protein
MANIARCPTSGFSMEENIICQLVSARYLSGYEPCGAHGGALGFEPRY